MKMELQKHKKGVRNPMEETAMEVFPETIQNPLALTHSAPNCEIVEEETEQNTSFKGISSRPPPTPQEV